MYLFNVLASIRQNTTSEVCACVRFDAHSNFAVEVLIVFETVFFVFDVITRHAAAYHI
jgi:hypothetical protein